MRRAAWPAAWVLLTILSLVLLSGKIVRAGSFPYFSLVDPATNNVAGIDSGGHVLVTASGVATPIPFPTFPWPVTWPSALPVSCGTCPTPIPFPTLGVNVLNTPAVVVANPGPTNAQGIPLVAPTNLPNPLPVTTPPPIPTDGTGFIGVHPTALPTISVACVNCSVPAPTSTVPGVITTPASSASSVTILAAGASASGWSLCNNSTQIAYVAFAATATSSAYTYQMPAAPSPCLTQFGPYRYQGIITAIWVSANGTMLVTTW